jgi:hypothetical protein
MLFDSFVPIVALTDQFLSLSHRFLSFPSCRLLLLCDQAKATRDVFDFARDGNLPDAKKCIMNGANIDEYKDSVREKKPKINVRHTHDPLERVPMSSGPQERVPNVLSPVGMGQPSRRGHMCPRGFGHEAPCICPLGRRVGFLVHHLDVARISI